MKTIRKLARILGVALLVLVVACGGFIWYWNTASPQTTCASCHEIESSSVMWAQSGHRAFHCRECHGSAFSNGLHSLKEKASMVVHHFTGSGTPEVVLDETRVLEMMDNCRRCHGMEYARWTSGGHSATYASLFLNEKHNAAEQLNADCLRCHGMFFGGTIEDLVSPLSRSGPWRLADTGKASQPAIPCLACHEAHRRGTPLAPAQHADPAKIHFERVAEPVPALFYDRYEKTHVETPRLPSLQVWEGDRKVETSDDPRQRVCVQCHAPNAFHQAGTGDDRTPRGVHEGLSCLACHAGHSNDAKQSCIDCHPAISNCRLDVTKMNTTYANAKSPHNIHFVSCTECHPKGIPPKRKPERG